MVGVGRLRQRRRQCGVRSARARARRMHLTRDEGFVEEGDERLRVVGGRRQHPPQHGHVHLHLLEPVARKRGAANLDREEGKGAAPRGEARALRLCGCEGRLDGRREPASTGSGGVVRGGGRGRGVPRLLDERLERQLRHMCHHRAEGRLGARLAAGAHKSGRLKRDLAGEHALQVLMDGGGAAAGRTGRQLLRELLLERRDGRERPGRQHRLGRLCREEAGRQPLHGAELAQHLTDQRSDSTRRRAVQPVEGVHAVGDTDRDRLRTGRGQSRWAGLVQTAGRGDRAMQVGGAGFDRKRVGSGGGGGSPDGA
eukprot:scaffold21510_cov111-Isochrysis_galbana.AAC.5